jgi:putative ABC transport system permease protein
MMQLPGILKIAYKLLINDRGKFFALLTGITFAVFLMVQMTSIFAGILARAAGTVTNIGAAVWIMDPAVNNTANTIPVPDYLLDAVRSVPGVRFAVPLYSGVGLVKLADGRYQAASVLGLDDNSLLGRPPLAQGRIEDIYAEDGFIVVDDAEYPKLGRPGLGTEFEINDHRGVIVGIARVAAGGLFGIPTLYTTYNRAVQTLPVTRYTTTFILAEVKDAAGLSALRQATARLGYLTLTRAEFIDRISDFYKYETGVGTNILLMTVISFIVGLSISGQTFYTFILENLDKFGALKAIGATSGVLVRMILFQAAFAALAGYGLGIGLCTLLITVAKLRLPSYAAEITWLNLALALAMVLVIAAVSGYIGVRKVLRIEPFDIFRS